MAHVLVIEDRRSIGMIFYMALTEENHTVNVVTDGASGLAAMSREPAPDVVILDLNMPGISGREVVETMRRDPSLQHIPVIIVSGSVPSADILPAQGSFQAFIEKPFDLNDIITTVEKLSAANASNCA
jgi:CheY-like chemotaxis protein